MKIGSVFRMSSRRHPRYPTPTGELRLESTPQGQTPHQQQSAGGEGWTRVVYRLPVRSKESDLYAFSLALVVFSQISLPAETNQIHRSGVLTSYDDAYYRAGQERKPIFILFT